MKIKTDFIGLLLVFAGLTVLTGCRKEPEAGSLPLLATTTATEITVNSAVLKGTVIGTGSSNVTARGFCWSSTPDPTISDNKLTEGKGLGQFAGRIRDLLPGTDYHVRAWATNLEGTSYGSQMLFRTAVEVTHATLITVVPEFITETNVVSGGDITDNGGGEITERGICWSTDPSPTIENAKATAAISGTASGRFTINLPSLEPGQRYFLRAYAINIAGISYGPEISFRTLVRLGIRSSDFPGVLKSQTVTFSIDTKVYVGLGSGETESDLWEWDKVTDRWTRLADFPGSSGGNPIGFAIGGKGYVFRNIAISEDEFTNEFWEYDPKSNRWTQKSGLPTAGLRSFSVAFSIGSKGYIGLGMGMEAPDYTTEYKHDFWEWNQATDVWTRKADFPGQSRSGAAAFAIGDRGYIGTGETSGGWVADFWEYDQQSDTWTRKTDFAGNARVGAFGFSIGNKGYIGAGYYGFTPDGKIKQDFWEWDQALNRWFKIGNVVEAGYANYGGSVGGGGYFFASLVSDSQPLELWTFPLISDN